MLRSFSFPGCLLFSILVSRYGLVAISQIIPDNPIRLTHAKSTQSQLAEKTNFDELSSIRFQDSVVGKVSNVKIPLAKRSEELNVHLEVPAKYLKNKNISAERLVKRVRRNTNDRAVFDEDEIETLTDIALQQCPYNTFCHRNRTHAPEFMSGFGSCCKDCFCDEQCGERNDCCWNFLDNRKIEETNKLSCITPILLPENEQLEDEPSYLMIDSCHENDSYRCSRENAAIWGPLYPAFSSTTSMIYYNRNCASCNGVTDSIPWDTYVSCNGTNSLNGLSLINGLKRKQCRVRFRPPKKVNSEKFVCHDEIISTCTRRLTDLPFEDNIDIRKACRRTKAYVNVVVTAGTLTYANIFCKLCNGHSHSPDEPCRLGDDFTRSSFTKFTTFIDWEVLDSATNEATYTNENSQKEDACRQNDVRHPTKVCTFSTYHFLSFPSPKFVDSFFSF